MAYKRIIFFSDNAAAVDIVNTPKSRHKYIMVLLISFFKLDIFLDYKTQDKITFPVPW